MQIKTTFYDIVGYMIPGFVIMLVGYLGYNHSVKSELTLELAVAYMSSLTGSKIILFAVLAYLMGHLLSSVSSLLIEDWIVKIPLFKNFKDEENILGEDRYRFFSGRYKDIYGYDYEPKHLVVCICHVESKQPAIYSTAFIFLSFYGMARNLSLILILYSLWELSIWVGCNNPQSFGYFFVSLNLGVIAFYHYLRFKKYYIKHILTGYVLPENRDHQTKPAPKKKKNP